MQITRSGDFLFLKGMSKNMNQNLVFFSKKAKKQKSDEDLVFLVVH